MTTAAFVFPGQGSQKAGMLSELADKFPQIQDTYQQASEVLGYDLWDLSQDDAEGRLAQTAVTQPAILTASVSIFRLWQELQGGSPALMAGHSLGEYSALVCSGVIPFEDAVGLVQKRGQYMQAAVPAGVGGMAAIVGLDDELVISACVEAAEGQVISAVNFNSPGQVVIAGHVEALGRAIDKCKEAGAKRALPLPVSAPFHCALMRPAADAFTTDLEAVAFSAPNIPVIQNYGLQQESDPVQIRSNLVAQIYNPVPWVQTIELLVKAGVDLVLEVGPGSVLGGLNRRINRELSSAGMNTPDAMDAALEKFS